MSEVSDTAITWFEWFTTRESAIVINQAKQEILFTKFDATSDTTSFLCNLEDEEEIVFLFRENFGDECVKFFIT